MDERGSQWTTSMLADSIVKWMTNGSDTAFIIGGADGLDPSIKRSADEVLALSALTLPHGLSCTAGGTTISRRCRSSKVILIIGHRTTARTS